MSFAGVELANASRTASYAKHMGLGMKVDDCGSCENFNEVMGDKPYTSPLVDQPDWFEPDNPDTWGFMGYLPLTAEGVEGSTRTATVTQLAGEGAYASRPHTAGREMRFTGVLIGLDEAAVQAGMTWLTHVLEGDYCRETGGCTGDHLCYFAACPEVCEDSPNLDLPDPHAPSPTRLCPSGEIADWVDSCVVPYERHMYRVTCIDGPHVLQEYNPQCGAMWEVEFTLMAGVPGPYGTPRFVGCADASTVPPVVIDEVDCTEQMSTQPLQDPDCVTPLPPRPPLVISSCLETPTQWRRYQVDIDAGFVPGWSEAAPTIRIQTGNAAANQVRLRFYPNPFGRDVVNTEGGCNFCGEFLVSYIPPKSLMVIDGVEQTAWVETYDYQTVTEYRAQRFTATHLLYGSGGGPMTWPALSCGAPYSMTVDVVPGTLDNLDICLCVSVRQ